MTEAVKIQPIQPFKAYAESGEEHRNKTTAA